jgi:murein DD-endopeptidase MepM/ murein hydrolase activator NlpD
MSQEYDLGQATLRISGDRTALDRELEKLKRYTDQLERRGIKVKFDADTGKATREVMGFTNRLYGLNEVMQDVSEGLGGNSQVWKDFGDQLRAAGAAANQASNGFGPMISQLGSVVGGVSRVLPALGQLGLAAMGVQAVFQGVSAALNGALAPLRALTAEAAAFNKQVAEGSIFASQSFAVLGPDGKAISGTANQMRALRGTITTEYKAIQAEVAKISGATSAEIYEGFNIILQNADALGEKGNNLANVSKLATRIAAGMNTLGVPGYQLRSEVTSLMMGNIGPDSMMARKLGYDSESVKRLQAEGKFYDDLMAKLERLYDGQKVLAESLENVSSNFRDVFQTIAVEGGQSLERGLAQALQAVLTPLNQLKSSFAGLFRSVSEFSEPLIVVAGQAIGLLVPIGSAIASIGTILIDTGALVTSILGTSLRPTLEAVSGLLRLAAKGIELLATGFSVLIRPVTVFMNALGVENQATVSGFFDALIQKAEDARLTMEQLALSIAAPFREMTRLAARARAEFATTVDPKTGQRRRLTAAEKDQQVNEAVSRFDARLGGAPGSDLRSTLLRPETQALLSELSQKYAGITPNEKQLAIAREVSRVRSESIRLEIQGLENVLRLMQSQRAVAEAMNQLADARRGVAMQRATFPGQLAVSPEVRLDVEERRNQLANQQEQERIRERRDMLDRERQIQDRQLAIQLKQQELQREQLTIQKLEAVIARDKVVAAQADVAAKLRFITDGPEREKRLREQQTLKRELDLRNQIVANADRALGLSSEQVSVIQAAAAAERSVLDVKAEILDIEQQRANLTLEQQQQLTRIQRQQEALKRETRALLDSEAERLRQQQQRTKEEEIGLERLGRQQKIRAAETEVIKAQAAASKAAAEDMMRLSEAQARANTPGAGIADILAAQIEGLAQGRTGFIDAAEATRALYDQRKQQLLQEQAMQRAEMEMQRQREESEMRIQRMRIQSSLMESKVTLLREQQELKRLRLQQQQDTLAQQAAAAAGAAAGNPAFPTLPPAYGTIANILPSGNPVINRSAEGRQSAFSPMRGRPHNGQDIGVDGNAPVMARMTGTVSRIMPGWSSAGGGVAVKYQDGTEGVYGHININPSLKEGQLIGAGQQVGTIYKDIRAGGRDNSHLHYEIRDAMGRVIDPLRQIEVSLKASAAAIARAAGGTPGVATNPGTLAGRLAAAGQRVTPERMALLDTIRWAEGTWRNGSDEGYRVKFGGGLFDPSRHPGGVAAGAYQFLPSTWQGLGGGAMTPGAQDLAALALIARRGVNSNQPISPEMIAKLAPEWAAFPTLAGASAYGQPFKPYPELQAFYRQRLAARRSGAGAAGVVPVAGTGVEIDLQSRQQAIQAAEAGIRLLEEQARQWDSEVIPDQQKVWDLQMQHLNLLQQSQQQALDIEARRAQLTAQILGPAKNKMFMEMTDSIVGGISGSIRDAAQRLRNGGDFTGFMDDILGSMTDRVLGSFLDFALAPLEKTLKESLFSTMSGIDPAEIDRQIAAENQATVSQFGQHVTQFGQIVAAGAGLPAAANPGAPGAGGLGPNPSGTAAYSFDAADAVSLPPDATGGGLPSLYPGAAPLPDVASSFDGLVVSMDEMEAAFQTVTVSASAVPQGFSGLQQTLGAVAGMLGGIGMAAAGIGRIGKGSSGREKTYNTLMGLAGIFGGIASFSGGLKVSGFLAKGGEVQWGRDYVVGENGPELFRPSQNGEIIPNGQFSRTRAALGAGGGEQAPTRLELPPGRLDVAYESEVINERKYVTEDQFRRGMRESARMGQAMTLHGIQHSVSTRRRIAMGG